MKQRFFNGEDKELKLTNVELLQTVKEKAIDRITISMNTAMLNDTIVTELGELIAKRPGNTKLFIQLLDTTGKHHVLLKSNSKSLDVRSDLINFIEQNEGLDYKIN